MKPFLQEVAEDLIGQFGDQLQHCTIVFNNKRPGTYLQKHLADLIKKPFFSPSFCTIQEFFAQYNTLQTADFYLQFFTLHKIYNALLKEEGAEGISASKFFSIAKVILADFAQIDMDLIDADKVYRDLEDISVINNEFDFLSPEQYEFLSQFWTSYSEGKHRKQQELFIRMWRRMPKLYHRFHASLKEQGYATNGRIYRSLAMEQLEYPVFGAKAADMLIFVGFNALSNAEAKIFKRLQDGGNALFYFDADPYYVDDPLQEAGLFLRKNLWQLELKNQFEGRRSQMQDHPHEVNVYQVQGQTAQAKILNNLLADNNLLAEEIGTTAIVLADESLLIPTLQTIPAYYNDHAVDLNVTMGFALASSSLYGLIGLWLDCQQEIQKGPTVAYTHVEAFLMHPLTAVSKTMRDKIQTALLTEKEVDISHARLRNQKGLFEVFFKKSYRPGDIIDQLSEMLQLVFSRLSSAQTLKKIDAELFASVFQELNRLHDTFGKHIGQEEISFVIYLVQKALTNVTVPLTGDPLKGVQVMGLLESRNLNFDHVVFLGFNEGIVPKSSIGNSFIPDSIRRVYGLPVLENQDAISAYMVYRLIQRAGRTSLVYNSLTDESTSGEPSRILKQLAYESNFRFNYYMLNLNVRTEPESIIQIEKAGNAMIETSLKRYLDKQVRLSPSALTQYILNPIDFFFNYIAGIKEPDEMSTVVEANEIGSILHKVMEYFYQDEVGKEITVPLIVSKKQAVPQLVRKAFAEVLFKDAGREVEHKGMQKVILAIVETYVGIILKQDESQAPFRIVALEQRVEADISFTLRGEEASVRLSGFIDRVDEKDGVTRIIDYKTGSDQLNFKDIPGLFNTDGKYINKALIQTLLYAYVYEQYSGRNAVEPNLYIVKTMAQDGVWFKSGKQTLEGAYLEETKQEFLDELRQKLEELFDAPYFKTSLVEDNYRYSIYKTLFGK